MSTALGILGFLGFIAFLVVLIVFAIKKRKKRIPIIGIIVCFIMFVVGICTTPSTPKPSTATTSSSTKEKQNVNQGYETPKNEQSNEKKQTEDPQESTPPAPTEKSIDIPSYDTGITYDQLARTPDDYNQKKVKFIGTVVQVIETDDETQLRLAVNDNYDKIIYCHVPKKLTSKTRILENDSILVRGVSYGLVSYDSAIGGNITIPQILVDDWGIN